MLTRLKLECFKNFGNAELVLGPLTVLIGANATGKSNLREAFRFLHAISRGYNLAEIFGEKYVGGGRAWIGIRGGTGEAAFGQQNAFALEVEFRTENKKEKINGKYRIGVDVGKNGKPPRVVNEKLILSGKGLYVFNSHPRQRAPQQSDPSRLGIRIRKRPNPNLPEQTMYLTSNQPILSQLIDSPELKNGSAREFIRITLKEFESMRFFALSPDSMRTPSIPGQTILNDRGENLSSVLQSICEDPALKRALIEWLRELAPMDAKDFIFKSDPAGKVLVTLLEENGQEISAYSASDGTLRFLALIAALLRPELARFYFLEELDTGIHPSRLYLLLELIERKVKEGNIQIVASTHSPLLLALLRPEALEHVSLTYRLKNSNRAGIQRITSIPHAREVIQKQDLTQLHASGWFEDILAFLEAGKEA